MISFRYHVVSLVASLLALAAGIAVGSGPLQRTEAAGAADTQRAEALASARARLAGVEDAAAFTDAYAAATAADVVAGRLEGRTVTLVSLPGVDDATREDLTGLVEQSGGRVTARVSLGQKLLDVANRQLAAELATQMQGAARAVRVPPAATGYERIGALLAHAVVSDTTGGSPVDTPGNGVLAGLVTAELVTAEDIDSRGDVALVVSGAPYGSADQRDGAGSIVATLLAELDARSAGVVLAGPAGAAAEDGLVGKLRADPVVAEAVSSVDVVDRVAGRVVTVLALAAESEGATGHYGSAGSADGPLPPDAG